MASQDHKLAASADRKQLDSVDAAPFSNSVVTPNKKKEEESGLDVEEILPLQRFFLLLDQWDREGKA